MQEMTISERLDCGSTPRKQDVDGTVDAVAADKRYGDSGQTIIDRRSFVGASSKRGVAGTISPLARLGENSIEPSRISRETVF